MVVRWTINHRDVPRLPSTFTHRPDRSQEPVENTEDEQHETRRKERSSARRCPRSKPKRVAKRPVEVHCRKGEQPSEVLGTEGTIGRAHSSWSSTWPRLRSRRSCPSRRRCGRGSCAQGREYVSEGKAGRQERETDIVFWRWEGWKTRGLRSGVRG